MQINQAIKVMILMGAISCSPSEPTNDQEAAPSSTSEPTAANTTPDTQEQETKADTKPEVRYYLLSEQ